MTKNIIKGDGGNFAVIIAGYGRTIPTWQALADEAKRDWPDISPDDITMSVITGSIQFKWCLVATVCIGNIETKDGYGNESHEFTVA